MIEAIFPRSSRTVPMDSANATNFSISGASSPAMFGFRAKKSLRSRLCVRRGSETSSAPPAHAGGDCSNFTVKSRDRASYSARFWVTSKRSNSMSQGCLFERLAGLRVSALRMASAGATRLAAYRTAASCAGGSGAEWNSSVPMRPGARGAGLGAAGR